MSHKIFENNLVIIHNKVPLTLSKPAYIGMCILELSKVLLYEFHYDYIKNKYGNNSKFVFTDTDCVLYEDVYEGFSNNKEIFDFSNYFIKSNYHDDSNKLVIGKMKNEQLVLRLKNLLDLSQRCICIWPMLIVSIKNQKV